MGGWHALDLDDVPILEGAHVIASIIHFLPALVGIMYSFLINRYMVPKEGYPSLGLCLNTCIELKKEKIGRAAWLCHPHPCSAACIMLFRLLWGCIQSYSLPTSSWGCVGHSSLHLKFYIMEARTQLYPLYSFLCIGGSRNGWMALNRFG